MTNDGLDQIIEYMHFVRVTYYSEGEEFILDQLRGEIQETIANWCDF